MLRLWTLVLLLGQPPGSGVPAPPCPPAEPAYLAEFRKMQAEMDKLQESVTQEYRAAKSEKDREAIMVKAGRLLVEKRRPLGEKALALVQPHAADKEAVQILIWIINYHEESPVASVAADLLARHHLEDPQTLDTVSRFQHAPLPWTVRLLQKLADADLPRDRKAHALVTLAECSKSKAELPQLLKGLDPVMTAVVEQRYGKQYLAELRAADPAKLEAEAVRRFEEAVKKYGTEKYGSQTISEYAAGALFEMRHLAVGKTAPDIEGEDIDGKSFKLSDYRGKVVVLDFWGNW